MTFYHGIQIENLAKSLLSDEGKNTPTDSEITAKIAVIKLDILRGERNQRLLDTDWVVTQATETGGSISTAWKTYRQALRDITKTSTSIEDVSWPTKPN